MLIKKDWNEQLEKILEHKKINEQAKNLLQGILYKIEISYKDYKKVKAKKQTEEKYVEQLIENIEKRCDKIDVIKPNQKLADENIQKELEKSKFYVGEEIVSYPIEEKILYAIEKKSRHPKILNNKYEEATIAISEIINTGKNIDRTEVLRDFNGWSWTTINKEIENIEANLIYQILQIQLGEEFLDNWCEDRDGIIDYLELLGEETSEKYVDLLIKIAIANILKENEQFAEKIRNKIEQIDEEIQKYGDTEKKIVEVSNNKKELLKKLSQIEKILGQESRLREEYQKAERIISLKTFRNQLNSQKQELLEQIEENSYLLNPSNFMKEKNKLIEQKEHFQQFEQSQEQVEKLLLQFIEKFLKYFDVIIKNTKDEDEILRLIYQFRYFMLLPFNNNQKIKDVEKLQKRILETEKKLVQKAIQKKVIVDVPFEIMRHLLESRIIVLEDLYYKITKNLEKYYVQIFDENISEEKFEIAPEEKTKINKKIKIFF